MKYTKRNARARDYRAMDLMASQVDTPKLMTTCPYCGRPLRRGIGADVGISKYQNNEYLICSDYPNCDTYGRIINRCGTYYMVSTPADKNLRALRNETHYYMTLVVKNGLMNSETELQKYIYSRLTIQKGDFGHVGEMNEHSCMEAIRICIDLLYARKDELKEFEKFTNKERHYSKDPIFFGKETAAKMNELRFLYKNKK